MKQNFIKTTDSNIAEKLSLLGFRQVDVSTNGIYIFLNTDKIQFSNDDIDKSKIQYSNILTF